MAVVADLGGGMSREELKREALSLFGGKRLTEGIASRLDDGLTYAVSSGRVELRPSRLYVAVV